MKFAGLVKSFRRLSKSLMNGLGRIARRRSENMWETVAGLTRVRASYYKSLYDACSDEADLPRGRYLDIGGWDLSNTAAFSADFEETFALDMYFPDSAIKDATCSHIHLVVADAHLIPFADCSFDSVSMISVIEHVRNPRRVLTEAIRVLKPNGELIIQVPNRYFPIEPHTGLPLLYYLPRRLREELLRALNYEYYLDYVPSYPTRNDVCSWIGSAAELRISKGVIIPPALVPQVIRPIYCFFKRIRMLNFIPQSWLSIYTREGTH